MRDELYQKVAERYSEEFCEIEKKRRNNSFRDIAGNLITGLENYAYLILESKDLGIKKRDKKNFNKNRRALRDYFRLLENHPEFKKAELKLNKGYFPEFDSEDTAPRFSSRVMLYVAYAKEKLEGDN